MSKIAQFSVFSSLVLLGCNAPSAPKVGNYQGTLIASSDGKLQKYAVAALLSRPTPDSIHLEMTGNPTIQSALDIVIDESGRTLSLNIPGTPIQNQELASDNGCFTALSAFNIHLCNLPTSLVIEAQSVTHQPIYSLSVEYFGDVAARVPMETPRSFTVDDAVAQTMLKDFSTQIEFQHMIQARLNAKSAYLNLLPHLSNGSILGLAGGPADVIGVLGMAGDLAPFLFPSRWLQARQAALLSDAESDALALMRGDAGLGVETFAYAIDHDTREVAFLDQDYYNALTLRKKVAGLETRNLVPAGTTEHLDSILAGLHDAMDDLNYPLQAELASMSQAMGFVNPLAVTGVDVPPISPTLLNGQEILNIADFQSLVLDRSIELRQMDSLIAAARTGVKADRFSWMDPSADVTQSLGFGLGATIAIDKAEVSALEIQKNQVASTLLQNLSSAIIQYNHSIDDLADSENAILLEKDRMDKLNAAIDSGQPVSATEITSIPLDQITWQINSLDALLDYRSSMAKIQRMLLQGYYSNLDGKLTFSPK